MRICVYLLARNAGRRSHGLTSRPLAHAISRRMAASRPREDAVAPLVGGELALRLRDACHDLGAAHGELLPCALRVGRRHDDVSALRRRRRAPMFSFFDPPLTAAHLGVHWVCICSEAGYARICAYLMPSPCVFQHNTNLVSRISHLGLCMEYVCVTGTGCPLLGPCAWGLAPCVERGPWNSEDLQKIVLVPCT